VLAQSHAGNGLMLRSNEELAQGEDLESRVRWLRQRAHAQLRHALRADNVYDKDERILIAMILYDHATAAAEHDSAGRLSRISS
jgi:hypothetical protein